MEVGKKDLSSARKKLQEYKLNRGGGGSAPGGPGVFVPAAIRLSQVDETVPQNQPSVDDHHAGPTVRLPEVSGIPPPPTTTQQSFLSSLGQSGGDDGGQIKVLNVNSDSGDEQRKDATANANSNHWASKFSNGDSTDSNATSTPMASQALPSHFQSEYILPDALSSESNLHTNFFQSTPIPHGSTHPTNFLSSSSSVSPPEHQQQNVGYYYDPHHYPTPTAPLFFNVQGEARSPLQQPSPHGHQSPESSSISPGMNYQKDWSQNEDSFDQTFTTIENERNIIDTEYIDPNQMSAAASGNLYPHLQHGMDSPGPDPIQAINDGRPISPPPKLPPRLKQGTLNATVNEDQHRMKSVQDALELQLEEQRKENELLSTRQSELLSQMDDKERSIQQLMKEKERFREETSRQIHPLNVRISSLYEENQRILKNSSDVGMELRSKLQEKTKQFEDMEQAFIIVSKSKMDFAEKLDQELEKSRELESIILQKDHEITKLSDSVGKLEERVKVELQKDAIIHQLEDQIRHFQVQVDSLQRQLRRAGNKIERLSQASPNEPSPSPSSDSESANHGDEESEEHIHTEHCSHSHHDDHENSDGSYNHSHHHDHDNHHDHEHDHSSHDHSHSHHDSAHDHSHHHDHHHGHSDHDHEHDHSDEHHHHHEDGRSHQHYVSQEGTGEDAEQVALPAKELAEMKKHLHHLEWENSTFRTDLDKLAEEAREKRRFEEQTKSLSEECEKLRNECLKLELVTVQLQGENDTIGDYIALYQTQKLALKESAKEKDMELANLANEKKTLLRKVNELSELLKTLRPKDNVNDNKGPLSEVYQCPHHQQSPVPTTGGDVKSKEIEGRIRDLLTEIPTLMENYHPCAVCSGRLLNV